MHTNENARVIGLQKAAHSDDTCFVSLSVEFTISKLKMFVSNSFALPFSGLQKLNAILPSIFMFMFTDPYWSSYFPEK